MSKAERNAGLVADAGWLSGCDVCGAVFFVKNKPRADQPKYCDDHAREAKLKTNRENMRRAYRRSKQVAE